MEESPLEDRIAKFLDVYDPKLARDEKPLNSRVLLAAQKFVEFFVLEVSHLGKNKDVPPGNFAEYNSEVWFRVIYHHVESWYYGRFGNAMKMRGKSDLDAATLVCDNPFLFKMPKTTSKLGTLGEDAWLCFHDSVQPDEDVLGWLQTPLHSRIFLRRM